MKDRKHLFSFIYIIIATVLFIALSFVFCSDSPVVSILVNALILGLITFEMSTYLSRIAWSNRLQILAFLPSIALFFVHTHSNYFFEGTIGVLLMLICLNVRQKIANKYIRRIYTIIVTIILYWAAGPTAMLFALTILVSRFSPFAFFPFVISFLLAGISLRIGHQEDISLSLTPLGFYAPETVISSTVVWMPWIIWLAVLSIGLTIRHYRIPQWTTNNLIVLQVMLTVIYAAIGSLVMIH